MDKSRNDKAYESGVSDGQKGDLISDAAMGSGAGDMLPGGGSEWDSYKEGYKYGQSTDMTVMATGIIPGTARAVMTVRPRIAKSRQAALVI